MNNNCKHLKQKVNRKLYCKKKDKEINIKECSNCIYKEYNKSNNNQIKSPVTSGNFERKPEKLKRKSNNLAKLERNRFSLFTDDNSKCIFCGSTYNLTWHEIFAGRNRKNSMIYGLCLRMCLYCHEEKQEDKEFNDLYHKKGQALFEETYPDLDFVEIFGRNYL